MELICSKCNNIYNNQLDNGNILCESFIWDLHESINLNSEVLEHFEKKYHNFYLWLFVMSYKSYPVFWKDKKQLDVFQQKVTYLEHDFGYIELDNYLMANCFYKLESKDMLTALNVIKRYGYLGSYLVLSKENTFDFDLFNKCLAFDGKRYFIDYQKVAESFCINDNAVVSYLDASDGSVLNCYYNRHNV